MYNLHHPVSRERASCARTSWGAGRHAAKRYACAQLTDRCGERVEVWDAADRVVFKFSVETNEAALSSHRDSPI
jgi:hypothetical protein